MEHIIKLLWVVTVAFISTIVDDFFILTAFFSDDSYNKKTVIIGQYIGISILIMISCVGFIFKFIVPIEWIGIMGILPIIIGSLHIIKLVKNNKSRSYNKIIALKKTIVKNSEEQSEKNTNIIRNIINSKVSFVAMVTFINGGDNIGVYTPLFATLDLHELILTIIIFLTILGVWCLIVILFVNSKCMSIMLKKYGKVCFPFVLILLGIYIILKCNTLSLF